MGDYTRVWADGSVVHRDDGAPIGGIGYVVNGKTNKEQGKVIGVSTIIGAEMLAIIHALRVFADPCNESVVIHTDSDAAADVILKGDIRTENPEISVSLYMLTKKFRDIKVKVLKSCGGESEQHDKCHMLALLSARRGAGKEKF